MSNLVNPVLPYNNSNILIQKEDVQQILSILNESRDNFTVNLDHINVNIYRRAFVHRSYCTRKNENFLEGNVNCPPECIPLQEDSNERLEFLGDSVLHLVVAKYLFERYPTENEGFLTTTRTKLVNGEMLATLSSKLGFNKYVLISSQIENNNGRTNKNILEDTLEAFIGAIMLDFDERSNNGYDVASMWIIRLIEMNVDFTSIMMQNTSLKDKLVKYCQHNYQFIPKFSEIDVTEHNGKRLHTIYVKNNTNMVIGIGKGHNKKSAELDASKKALEYYNVR